MAQLPPEGVTQRDWEIARAIAAERHIGEGKRNKRQKRKDARIRRAYRLGYCDTSGNVAAIVEEEEFMNADQIHELDVFKHNREGYEVEVGPRPTVEGGRILVKDPDDSGWKDGVIFRRLDQGEKGDVYVRTEADFRAKFSFARTKDEAEVVEDLEEAEEVAEDTETEPPEAS